MQERISYDKIIEIVKSAGKSIQNVRLDSNDIYDKEGYSNFVTKHDKEVQAYIINRLTKEVLPEAHFMAEEDEEKTELAEEYTFILDPIDGTTNFIFDYKTSCISLALLHQKQVIFGVVYQPYTDECYTAIKGQGAFLNGEQIKATTKGLDENLVAFGCARYNSESTEELFVAIKELYLKSLGIRNSGSSAIDLCRVAAGKNGLYFELKLQPWDYAAASLIIAEAGGVITQVDGTPISLQNPSSILAGGIVTHLEGKDLLFIP